jgi:DNA-directed RNA polymerase subunit RPC12/RpoP
MHERALRPSRESRVAALFDRPVRERNGLELTYRLTPEAWIAEAALGGKTEAAPLTWIFGAGTLAFTPVGIRNGVYFEHRVSWYPALGRPGMTMGHPPDGVNSAGAGLGQPQKPETIYRCFHCHATGVKPGPDLTQMIPGIQCERCHAPAAAHVAAPSRQNIRRDASIEACAECHRMPDPKALSKTTPEKSDPMSIRFAPVGLMASKCYSESRALNCIVCHDPHGRPHGEKFSYDEKCRSCHAPAFPASSHCPRAENANCLGCHMKKATPLPGLTFTDHRIRVYPARN